ncbi:MAG: MBL fold metallo-hydrolase [Caldicoprobacterales bacterium]
MSLKVCSLFSGSSGNSTYLGTEKTHILVDAGLAGKYIIDGLKDVGIDGSDLNGILITHEHVDHIKGAGVLSRRFNIPIYANEKTWAAMESKIGRVSPSNIRIFDKDMDFYIQDINVQAYEIPHDAADPVGFSFYNNNKKISITTDLGYTNKKLIKTVMDSDMVILEANHDQDMLINGPYPAMLKRRILSRKGHLSKEDSGKALLELVKGRVTHVLLAHLSRENNHPQLALDTVTEILEDGGVKVGKDIFLDMTYRDRISNVYQFK